MTTDARRGVAHSAGLGATDAPYGEPGAAAPLALPMRDNRRDADSRTLYRSLLGFFVVTIIQPQHILPLIGLVKPGLILCATMLIAWFGSKDRDYFSDTVFKQFAAFLFLIA